MRGTLESYLESLRTSLPRGLGSRQRARILREVEEHILERCEDEQGHGATPADALERALARLGSPAYIAAGFSAVVDTQRIRLGRLVLLAGLALALLAVGVQLIAYPFVAGSMSASLRDLLLCAALLALYARAGLDTIRARSPSEARTLWYGMMAGLGTAALTACSAIGAVPLLALLWGAGARYAPSATLLRIDHSIQEFAVAIPLLACLVLSLLAGAMAASRTGRISTGAVAGMWTGMLSAVGIAAPSLLLRNPLADTLARMEWIHDPTCLPAHGAALAACEVGDSLGGMAICFLMVPLLGIGLGIMGGLLGHSKGGMRSSWLALSPSGSMPLSESAIDLSVAAAPLDTAQPESSQDTHIVTVALFSAILLMALIAALQLHV